MDTQLLQNILDVVMKFFIPYCSPFIFLYMVTIYSEKLISLVKRAVNVKMS